MKNLLMEPQLETREIIKNSFVRERWLLKEVASVWENRKSCWFALEQSKETQKRSMSTNTSEVDNVFREEKICWNRNGSKWFVDKIFTSFHNYPSHHHRNVSPSTWIHYAVYWIIDLKVWFKKFTTMVEQDFLKLMDEDILKIKLLFFYTAWFSLVIN